VRLVAERLAEVHGTSPEAIAAAVRGNLDRLFRIAETASAP
jgi:Tat protein secretion system quality control protein TatD with DNase activity